MLTEFIRKLQRPGRMVVCDPFKIRTTHTSTFPLTTAAARRTFRSNLNTRSRQNSTAYLAGCVVVVSWVSSSLFMFCFLGASFKSLMIPIESTFLTFAHFVPI